jgi:hypothetical protein
VTLSEQFTLPVNPMLSDNKERPDWKG